MPKLALACEAEQRCQERCKGLNEGKEASSGAFDQARRGASAEPIRALIQCQTRKRARARVGHRCALQRWRFHQRMHASGRARLRRRRRLTPPGAFDQARRGASAEPIRALIQCQTRKRARARVGHRCALQRWRFHQRMHASGRARLRRRRRLTPPGAFDQARRGASAEPIRVLIRSQAHR